MNIRTQISIQAPVARIWQAITDIDNAAERIEDIQSIEILERPDSGLVGLKWREVRTMFGKQATEVMWITDVTEGRSYRTRAESHGSIYRAELEITGEDGDATLAMELGAEPRTVAARVLSATVGRMFVGATRKALLKDLQSIKASVETE